MATLDETGRLLDLLREAGGEPVSLDELAIAGGLADPAVALLDLELAGHAVARVQDTRADRRITCVRLRAEDEQPPAAPATTPGADRRPVVLLTLAVLLLVALARR